MPLEAEVAVLLTAGVAVGAAAGLLGVGGGTLIVPLLVLVLGFPQHRAEATSLAVVVPTAVAGSAAHRRRGVGDLRLALLIGAAGAGASVPGVLIALALPADQLRAVFAIFLGLTGLHMSVKALRQSE
jgi:uncharacterized membrane protein YfcA